jgi:hypothetical protein
MNDQQPVSIDDQIRAKSLSHRAAARAPIEVKFARLLQLQKIESEMARVAGRPAKKPWNISTKNGGPSFTV